MQSTSRKPILIVIIIVLVLAVGAFAFLKLHKSPSTPAPQPVVQEDKGPKHEIIGSSVEGRNIEAFTYGNGTTSLMFVGGMHGGYEWNSVLLAYQFMDYLEAHPELIPKNLSISVIPSANPDGVFKVIGKEGRFAISDVPTKKQPVGTGRFNAHDVDLNRNFDCNWKPTSSWQSKIVSAGTSAFSEPEAQAIRDFALKNKPAGAIFWHSQADAVYASECNKGILPKTLDIMTAYAKAAGYPAVKSFDAYPVSGDSEGWLASVGIPAITVELKTHETVEWDKNLAGIKALLTYYSQK
jgi:g-D-glutamyl-meso-diaminopimelate peptidase